MQYSIVNLSEVKNKSYFRIDAEYWKPEIHNIKILLNQWNNCCFGDKIDILTDYHANGSYEILKNHVKMVDNEDYALMIRTVDLENENYKNNVKYISESAYNFLKKTKIFGGEIIINKVGSAGAVFRMPYLNIPVSLGMNQFLIKVKDIISDYVFAFLKTKYGEKLIKQRITGAVPQSIDKDSIKSIPIFVPSKYFQQSIADLVNTSYTLRQSADTLYKEAENILLEELGLKDFKPQNKKCFVKNLSDTQKVGQFDAEYFQPKYEEIIEKIKGYKGGYDVLENFIENYSTGYPYKSEKYQKFGIPVIRIANVGKNKLELENNPAFISEEYSNISKKDIAKAGNILISMSGTIGNVAEIPENIKKCCINQRVLSFESKNINIKYLVLFLNSLFGYTQFEQIGVGGLQVNLSYNDIKNLIIPLLPEQIQSTISLKIQQSFKNREKSKQLLEVAKRAVEIAIEENEEVGLRYIEENE